MEKLEPKIKFDRNQILENIHALIRKKNLKIRDVETASGLSVGYLAKLANTENTLFRLSVAPNYTLNYASN